MTEANGVKYRELVTADDEVFVLREAGSLVRTQADGTRTNLAPVDFKPSHIAVDATHIYWVSTRSYCLLLHVDATTGRYASDKSECRDGRDETVVLRAGRSF